MKLSYHTIGLGPPLIILHGLLGSSDNWHSLAKRLSNHAQVITVDLRNHGHSPHSQEQTYQLMVDDLAKLFNDLNINSADIIGHSLGGKLAMLFTEIHAKRVNKLLVVDISPRQYADEHSKVFQALLAIDLSKCKKRSDVDSVLAMSISDRAVRQFLLMNLDINGEKLSWRANIQSLSDNYPELILPVCQNKTITIDSCFIRGGNSSYIQSEDEALIKRTFPNSKCVTIEQAGHWLHVEKPDEFLQQVSIFFNYD